GAYAARAGRRAKSARPARSREPENGRARERAQGLCRRRQAVLRLLERGPEGGRQRASARPARALGNARGPLGERTGRGGYRAIAVPSTKSPRALFRKGARSGTTQTGCRIAGVAAHAPRRRRARRFPLLRTKPGTAAAAGGAGPQRLPKRGVRAALVA